MYKDYKSQFGNLKENLYSQIDPLNRNCDLEVVKGALNNFFDEIEKRAAALKKSSEFKTFIQN